MKQISSKLVTALAFGVFFFVGTPVLAQQIPDDAPAAASSSDSAIPEDIPAEDASVDDSADATVDTATPAATDQGRVSTAPAMNPAPADPKLLPVFKQFGELPGLTALMDDFMIQLLADKRTRPFFEQADQAMIKKHLTEQFCVILGGPCTYTGRDMKSVHAGLGITRGDFNALVEDLQIAMTKHHVPFHAQNKLLAKLAPLHRDIETK
jgi:hemoglobin